LKIYRVILFLNYLSKVLKGILTKHFNYLVKTISLFYSSQIRNKLYKLVINIILLLKNKIELNKANKFKTSILFFNIKEAFDYIFKNRLIQILINLKLLISFIY
jgi:hypothetical protein